MSDHNLKQQAEAYLDDWERHFAAQLGLALGAAAAGLAPGHGDDDARGRPGGGADGGDGQPAGRRDGPAATD